MTTIEVHQPTPSVHVGERVQPERPKPVAWPDIPCAPADAYEAEDGVVPAGRGPDARDTGREPVLGSGRR